jgi:hypothetical protein
MLLLAILFPVLFATAAVSVDYPPANPTFDATSFTSWTDEEVRSSRKAKVYVPFTAADGSSDMVSVLRLDLVGNDYERGYAHGHLLAKGKL